MSGAPGQHNKSSRGPGHEVGGRLHREDGGQLDCMPVVGREYEGWRADDALLGAKGHARMALKKVGNIYAQGREGKRQDDEWHKEMERWRWTVREDSNGEWR